MLKLIRHAIALVQHHYVETIVNAKRSTHWPTVEKHFLEEHSQCESCGTKKNLQVHHCLPFHIHPELELSESNLIVLCMSIDHLCHYRIGHANLSWKMYNPNVRKDAAKALAHPEKFDAIVKLAATEAKKN